MLFLALLAAAPLQFHFDASEFANAVYHVGCLTGRLACTQTLYTKFWNEKYHATREDGVNFDTFGRTFTEIENQAGPSQPAPFLPNYLFHQPALRARVRIVAAALESKSANDFQKRAAGLAKPEQIERLAKVLDHVQTRLHPWWESTGRAIVEQRIKGIERDMKKLGVPLLAQQAAEFFEAKGSSRDLYVHAIPSPEFDQKDASANPAFNHFCIEITKNFDPGSMASIALHELSHSLYELSPVEKKQAMLQQFADSRDPSALPIYMFMNEAMATAIQLLLLERNGRKEDDPYHDPFIPRLAQGTLPVIRQSIESKTTLFNGFADRYMGAARTALGADADRIRFRFSAPAVLGNPELTQSFLEHSQLRFFVTTEDEWKQYPRLNAVRLLTYEEAGRTGNGVPVSEHRQKHRGFAYLRRSKQGTQELLLIGNDKAAVVDLTKRMVSWTEPVADGLLFTID